MTGDTILNQGGQVAKAQHQFSAEKNNAPWYVLT
jgi:hypothetical protein